MKFDSGSDFSLELHNQSDINASDVSSVYTKCICRGREGCGLVIGLHVFTLTCFSSF